MTNSSVGMRVVEVGPASDIAGWLLASLGARVLQVRDSARPPESHSEFFDRGKRRMALHLGTESSGAVIAKLIGWASVTILSVLDSESTLASLLCEEARRQGKTVVLIRGTGGSSDADRPMTDLTAWASSGMLFASGYPHRPPTVPGGRQAYVVAGLNAAIAVVAAEVGEPAHRPQEVEVRLQECLLSFAPERGVPTFLDSGKLQARDGVSRTRPGLGILPASDGLVSIMVSANRQWDRLAEWMATLGAPPLLEPGDFANHPRARYELLDTINAWLAEAFSRHPVAHLVETGQSRGIAITPVHTLQQFAAHELFETRRAIERSAEGRKFLRSPWRQSDMANVLCSASEYEDELQEVLAPAP